MPPESTNLDELDRTIQSFKIEFTRYLNGGTELPPEGLRLAIKNTLRRLQDKTGSTAENFRLSSLEARFNTISELFNRQVLQREQGPKSGRGASPEPAEDRRYVIGDELERDTAAALYASLYGDTPKATSIDFETFIFYLESQRDLIRNKIGCSRVQFRVAREDGKRKLKARPAVGLSAEAHSEPPAAEDGGSMEGPGHE